MDLDGQRVQPGVELRLERLVDRPVLFDPAHFIEGGRGNPDAEMGVAPFPPTGMTMMALGFIDHFEMAGCEFARKDGLDLFGDAHGVNSPFCTLCGFVTGHAAQTGI